MKRLIPALALTMAGVGCAPYAYHDTYHERIYPRYDSDYPGYIAYPVYDNDYPAYRDWHRDDRYRDDDGWRSDHRWGDRDRRPDHRDFDHRNAGHDHDRARDRDDRHPAHDRPPDRRDWHDAHLTHDVSPRSSFQPREPHPPVSRRPGVPGPGRVPD